MGSVQLGCLAALALVLAGWPGRATAQVLSDPPAEGVLIDFAAIPDGEVGDLQLTFEVRGLQLRPWTCSGGFGRDEMPEIFRLSVIPAGAKVELVGKSSVRVLGWERGGKFYPAVRGRRRPRRSGRTNCRR